MAWIYSLVKCDCCESWQRELIEFKTLEFTKLLFQKAIELIFPKENCCNARKRKFKGDVTFFSFIKCKLHNWSFIALSLSTPYLILKKFWRNRVFSRKSIKSHSSIRNSDKIDRNFGNFVILFGAPVENCFQIGSS